jgi:hypothetical protein
MHWDEIIWVVLSDMLSDKIPGTLVVLSEGRRNSWSHKVILNCGSFNVLVKR